MSIVDEVFATLAARGGRRYGNERVTQLSHALQCAANAQAAGADEALVVAALLHDYGHLMDGAFGQEKDSDRFHENLAASYLATWFPPQVTEPIRLHVPAKRYLCAVESDYFDGLSAGSVRSLELQGGVFSDAEAEAFAAQPHSGAATKLRRWDDLAKDPAADSPDLEHYRETVVRCLKAT